MKMLLACMWAAIAICAIWAVSANAHTKYAGHTCKYWYVTSPTSGYTTRYRECMRDQWGCGTHWHEYLTEYRRYTIITGWIWQDVHTHLRSYACHAV